MIRVPFKKFFRWKFNTFFGVNLNLQKNPHTTSVPFVRTPDATWVRVADSYLAKNPNVVGFGGVPSAVFVSRKRRRFGEERSSTCPSSRALCFHSSWKRWCVATWGEQEDSAFFFWGGRCEKQELGRSWEEKVDVCVKKVLKDQGWTACNALANVDGKRGFFTMQVQPFVWTILPYKTQLNIYFACHWLCPLHSHVLVP